MLTIKTTRPLLIGRFAVYAPDLETAQKVYAVIGSEAQTRGFGTVTLDDGEEIDWVDMAREVVPSCEGLRQAK